jgi:hypothetical protein
MVPLTEIGTLVSIVKGLLDLVKSGSSLLGRKDSPQLLQPLQQRIAIISEQLQNSIALTKLLPLWLKEHEAFDLFADKLDDEKVRSLDTKLRELIRDSVHDHFSSAFFRTNFKSLPPVSVAIDKFREKLKTLETQIDFVPPGDAAAWRHSWPVIKVRMSDLRRAAVEVENLAEQAQADVVRELREAGEVTTSNGLSPKA